MTTTKPANELTPEERVQFVEQQITAVERGHSAEMDCPYCGLINKRGEPLCCELFAMAAMAVLHRKDTEERIREAERIGEKVSLN